MSYIIIYKLSRFLKIGAHPSNPQGY